MIKMLVKIVQNATNSARSVSIVFGTSQFKEVVKDTSTMVIFRNIAASKST